MKKFNEWFSNAIAGEEDYLLVTKQGGKWKVHENGVAEELSALAVVLFKEDEVKVLFEWNDTSLAHNERNLAFVVKDEKKILLNDEVEGIYAFGVSEKLDDAEGILIFLSTEDVNLIITATREVKKISMCFNVATSSINSMKVCMGELIHKVASNIHKSEEEKNDATKLWFEG